MNIGCVLMAAGTASRFGENKLLYPMKGHSLLEWSMRAVPSSLFARAVAVVSDPAVAAIVARAGYRTIVNPNPARGQGTTVALGAAAMEGLDGVLFCVGDQPHLTLASVTRLVGAFTPDGIYSLAHGGKRGNPVLFPAFCIPELAALAPHETGRAVIARYPGRLHLVEADDARELFDIDTKQDLEG